MTASWNSLEPPVGSPEFFRDPYSTYRFLRERGPLTHLGPNLRACTRYEDCFALLHDPHFSARRYMRPLSRFTPQQQNELATWVSIARNQVIFMDPPEHTRLRVLLMQAFSPDAVERLIGRIEELFGKLLDDLPRGIEFDFMSKLAQRFPAMVIGELLGMPSQIWDRLFGWCDIFMEFLAAVPPPFELALAAQRATTELIEYAQSLVEERALRPGRDLISLLLQAGANGDTLTRQELLAQCALLLVAGHETARNLIGNSLYTLVQHPAQIARLRHDPSLMRSAVEEVLRFQGPVQGISRVAPTNRRLYGETLEAGQSVVILVGSANRDPLRFPDPERFDIERKHNPHLTFGAGSHTCLGSHLARLEAQVVLSMLLRRYKRIELCDADPPWTETLLVRGLKRLNLALV